MPEAPNFDYLAVVNGPEDGSEFPLLRSPFLLGATAECLVRIGTDQSIEDVHAHLSATAEGYRVRSMTRAPVYVDGKRAGRLRSRILRSGESLKAGNTHMIMRCPPQGLASRSKGVALESDLAYTMRAGGRLLLRLVTGLLRMVLHLLQDILGFMNRHKFISFIILSALALYFIPQVRYFVFSHGLRGIKALISFMKE
jgi:type III secretion system (T3SS) inner membrane Yop/YscD-like protein